jgi:hypothetical protein
MTRLWTVAILAAAVAFAIKLSVHYRPEIRGALALIPYAVIYLLLADPTQLRRLRTGNRPA